MSPARADFVLSCRDDPGRPSPARHIAAPPRTTCRSPLTRCPQPDGLARRPAPTIPWRFIPERRGAASQPRAGGSVPCAPPTSGHGEPLRVGRLCAHYRGLLTGCSLRSVSAIGPRRAGATVGRLLLPILHRSLCYTRSLGTVFLREAGVLPPGSARPVGRGGLGYPLRRLRPARPRRRYLRRALPRPGQRPREGPVAGRDGVSNGELAQRMPLAPLRCFGSRWRTGSVAPAWIAVLPGERAPACPSAR